MREVLDRLKAQLLSRLPHLPTASSDGKGGIVFNHGEKVDLSELGAVASAVRDYMEAELMYQQAVMNGASEETS